MTLNTDINGVEVWTRMVDENIMETLLKIWGLNLHIELG